ncbi:hypothetical protein HBH74_088190 [Parastagonospora nodorum]|nr:hypothetical protein HBH74_088190 [Parastagonospora nodorum]KAH4970944.1 hypothetical protein HBH73_054810 [Parastagonospora nodorum]
MPRLIGDVFDWDAEPDYEYISPEFANDCTRLPVDTPADRAHLIHMDSYNLAEAEEDNGDTRYDVKLWDAVCTMLFKVSTAVLDQFLDSQTFQLVLELDCSTEPKLIISRQGRQVMRRLATTSSTSMRIFSSLTPLSAPKSTTTVHGSSFLPRGASTPKTIWRTPGTKPMCVIPCEIARF